MPPVQRGAFTYNLTQLTGSVMAGPSNSFRDKRSLCCAPTLACPPVRLAPANRPKLTCCGAVHFVCSEPGWGREPQAALRSLLACGIILPHAVSAAHARVTHTPQRGRPGLSAHTVLTQVSVALGACVSDTRTRYSLATALCSAPGRQDAQEADLGQIRDPLFHGLGHPGAVSQDHGEERLSGAAMGALHHAKRRLSAAHELSSAFHGVGVCFVDRVASRAARLLCTVSVRGGNKWSCSLLAMSPQTHCSRVKRTPESRYVAWPRTMPALPDRGRGVPSPDQAQITHGPNASIPVEHSCGAGTQRSSPNP